MAESLDALGDVQVQDITLHIEPTDGEDHLTMTVYCNREARRTWLAVGIALALLVFVETEPARVCEV